jgi:mannosidase alpha-like ER degradation enhancer 1
VGQYSVKQGQLVYVNDSKLSLGESRKGKHHAKKDVPLRLFLSDIEPSMRVQTGLPEAFDSTETLINAQPSFFGFDLTSTLGLDGKPPPIGYWDGLPVIRHPNNLLGCAPYGAKYENAVFAVHRGDCTFLEKLLMAKHAGAAGVIVLSDEELGINPTANEDEIVAAGDLLNIALVVLKRSASEVVLELLDMMEYQGVGRELLVAVDPERRHGTPEQIREANSKDASRVLYLNGHPLLNSRLLV